MMQGTMSLKSIILVVFWLVNLYSLLVYIEHNRDESPKDCQGDLWVVKQYVSSRAVYQTYNDLSDLNIITTLHHLSVKTPDGPRHNVE